MSLRRLSRWQSLAKCRRLRVYFWHVEGVTIVIALFQGVLWRSHDGLQLPREAIKKRSKSMK